MCLTKDLIKHKIIKQEFKTYKNNLLKLTRACKFKVKVYKKSKNNIKIIQVNGRDVN